MIGLCPYFPITHIHSVSIYGSQKTSKSWFWYKTTCLLKLLEMSEQLAGAGTWPLQRAHAWCADGGWAARCCAAEGWETGLPEESSKRRCRWLHNRTKWKQSSVTCQHPLPARESRWAPGAVQLLIPSFGTGGCEAPRALPSVSCLLEKGQLDLL